MTNEKNTEQISVSVKDVSHSQIEVSMARLVQVEKGFSAGKQKLK